MTKQLFRITEDYIKPASEVITLAFFNDPVIIHYIPDPIERKEKSKYIFAFEIRYSVLYGEVYATSENLEGITAWRSPENVYITPDRELECGAEDLISKLGSELFKRISPIENYFLKTHKKHAPFPHWFLSPLVVNPKYQGRGYASILLRAMFDKINKKNLPIYLSTNVKKNSLLYQHFGFKIIELTTLPGTKISHWSMLREKTII